MRDSRYVHVQLMTGVADNHGSLVTVVTLLSVNFPQMRVMGIRVDFIRFRRHFRIISMAPQADCHRNFLHRAGFPCWQPEQSMPLFLCLSPRKRPCAAWAGPDDERMESPQIHRTAIAEIKTIFSRCSCSFSSASQANRIRGCVRL